MDGAGCYSVIPVDRVATHVVAVLYLLALARHVVLVVHWFRASTNDSELVEMNRSYLYCTMKNNKARQSGRYNASMG